MKLPALIAGSGKGMKLPIVEEEEEDDDDDDGGAGGRSGVAIVAACGVAAKK